MSAHTANEPQVGVREGEPLWFLRNRVTVRVASDRTDGRMAVVEFGGPQGDQPPLHVHHRDEEGFCVLEGRLRLWIGPEVHDAGAGDFLLAPRGIPHTYRVQSEEGARWLVVTSPGGFDRFVSAFGEPAGGPGLPEPAGPPDVERLNALAAECGIEILGPPGTLPA